ncbi:hypothetical protein E3Q16_04371 [Wallemia mellicola]|nr:hypothetical protein E3Q24_04341 [Wallemia mellicola]TIB78662.1 hypothetical protein E3Q21_04345 [Wallemia mellicola]TIB83066.1 hypothetical protein E3Q20_04314 [Wallemia mellicola]TIB98000.1 hypothetical protein E3Q16_04371 [Wallemia mellicola]TIC19030.1 hypothetical protein E3Q12_04358 [Wallemia mellicola]
MRKLRLLISIIVISVAGYFIIHHHIQTVGLPPSVYRIRMGILSPQLIHWEEETDQFKKILFYDDALLTPPGIKTPIIQSPNNQNPFTQALPSIPVNEIQVYPRTPSLPPNAPDLDQILFVMTTTSKRAQEYSQLWSHFLDYDSQCLVMLSPSESQEQHSLEYFLRHERGLNCYVRTSNVDKYENRMLSLPAEALQFAPNIDWVVIGDDDTTFIDIRLVQRMLAKYDPSQDWCLGGSTESARQFEQFGKQAFGGAGIFLSNSLAQRIADTFELCTEEFRDEMGGDGKLSKCAALSAEKDMKDTITHEKGLHQLDLPGNAEGFFQSGQPFISVHHLINGWSDVIPSYFPKYMSEDWTAIKIILRAAKFLGGDNLFRRFAFDGGRTLVTLGHSIIVFRETLTPEHYKNVEHTWFWPDYTLIDSLPTRSHNKRSYEYFLKDIYPTSLDLSTVSGYTEQPPSNWNELSDLEKDFALEQSSTVTFVYEEWYRKRTLKMVWDETRSDVDLKGDGQWFGQDWLDQESEYLQLRYQNISSHI